MLGTHRFLTSFPMTDQIMYQLYVLTEEEIEIVEGRTR